MTNNIAVLRPGQSAVTVLTSPTARILYVFTVIARSDDLVLKVAAPGSFNFRGKRWRVARALAGLEIALRPDPDTDGRFDLYFCQQRFAGIDLNHHPGDS